jgi:DNA repair protein RecO (recombination protein O)
MQTFKKTEGVVLKRIPFQEHDLILTLFSQDQGIIKCIAKGANRPKCRYAALLDPLTRLEFLYREGRGELWKCSEMTALNHRLALRQNFAQLTAACDMGKALLTSQLLYAPAAELYALFNAYLEHLPLFQEPDVLALSFRLKLLRHEGIWEQGTDALLRELAFCRHFSEIERVVLPPHFREKVESLFHAGFGSFS